MTRSATPFNLTLIGLSCVLLALLLGFRDLPMVDLPHHSALLTLWLNFPDPFQGDQNFVPNFRTPYLLTYVLARLIAPLTGAVAAFKLLVWAAVVSNALAHTVLARRLGYNQWLGLIGFLTGLGHAFYFGFISFLFTTPLVICSWVLALQHAEQPTVKRGGALAALLTLILVSHGIAFSIASLVAASVLWLGGGEWWQRMAPFAAPGLVTLTWFIPGKTTDPIGRSFWTFAWDQGLDLPASLVSMYRADTLATLFGILILVVVIAQLGRPRSTLALLPMLLTVGGYAFFPPRLWGLDWLNARFTGFVIPALLLGFQPRSFAAASAWTKLRSFVITSLVSTWFFLLATRLVAFNRETNDFHQLIEPLPRGLMVRSLVFERESPAFPSVPALLHLPVYYQIEKGGFHGFSFAVFPSSVVVFREPRTLPRIGLGAEWHPEGFNAPKEVPLYDYFIVHSATDRTSELFSDAPEPITLDAHYGNWWGYRHGSAPPAAETL